MFEKVKLLYKNFGINKYEIKHFKNSHSHTQNEK